MKPVFYRRVVHTFLAALHALMSVLFLVPTHALAQSIDSQPPEISVEAVADGIRGDSQVFTATVTDNVGIESVTLYYRFNEDADYVSKSMVLLSATDIYTASIATDSADDSVHAIQYYVGALDLAGNRTLQGFAFDPRERLLLDKPLPLAEVNEAAEPPATGMSTQRKIAYGLLGLVVVGALASSGGGGGASPEPGVGVTVVVDQLP